MRPGASLARELRPERAERRPDRRTARDPGRPTRRAPCAAWRPRARRHSRAAGVPRGPSGGSPRLPRAPGSSGRRAWPGRQAGPPGSCAGPWGAPRPRKRGRSRARQAGPLVRLRTGERRDVGWASRPGRTAPLERRAGPRRRTHGGWVSWRDSLRMRRWSLRSLGRATSARPGDRRGPGTSLRAAGCGGGSAGTAPRRCPRRGRSPYSLP